MINLNIHKDTFVIDGLKNYKYSKKYFNNQYKVYFFGYFRNSINHIDEIILNFKDKSFNNKNIEKIFRKIGGICTIVICSENEIKICASLYHPYLKIFKENNSLKITDSEFNVDKKLSESNVFLKMMVHHSYFFHKGISNDVIDFIGPGSLITIKNNKQLSYNFDWYLNFEEFCSRNDHDQIVSDLSSNYSDVFDNLDQSKKYYFALSAGLDSAIAFGAALEKNNFEPFHIARGIYADELDATRHLAKFFGKKLTVKYKYANKYTALDFNDDITEILDFNYNNVKKDSVFFPLHSDSNFLKKEFPDSHVFTGASDPLLLTIHHMMVYSDRVKKEFGYSENKSKRYFYSIDFFEKLKENDYQDHYNLINTFPSIHPYYIPLLSSFIDQLTKQYDFREKYFNNNNSITVRDTSPIKNLNDEHYSYFDEIKKKNAIFVINKILKSDFFQEKLKVPEARIAQILLKFLHFLGQYGKETHQTSMMHDETNLVEHTAVNGPIAITQLSVLIDDKLTNFSKWHSFKVFEKMNRINFEQIYKRPSLKNYKYVLSRIHSKLRSKFKNLPEHDDKFALINNKSLRKFILNNQILEKYNDFKSGHEMSKLMYDYPTEEELLKTDDLISNFWKINNILNIVSKLK